MGICYNTNDLNLREGIIWMRRKVFAWVAGSNFRRLLFRRLFQLADLVCTLHLIELRLLNGLPMTLSEMRFFGGPRNFKRNVLKKIKTKEI